MKLNEIHLRDPFVLPWKGNYYLYGTRGNTTPTPGFDVYVSKNLEDWDGPHSVFERPEGFWADKQFWAPEVHAYGSCFYMLATFKKDGVCRGTQILQADSPLGPFELYSDGPVTPQDWECLDGTLYIDQRGVPYMVFCHEWLQIHDGTVCAMPLTNDLKAPAGEPVTLFHGSDPKWAVKENKDFITDGPFFYRAQNGELLMIWSSFAGEYVQAVSRSRSGEIEGPWEHDETLLFSKDGGHGMIFRTFDGILMLPLHQPNQFPLERPRLFALEEQDGKIKIK